MANIFAVRPGGCFLGSTGGWAIALARPFTGFNTGNCTPRPPVHGRAGILLRGFTEWNVLYGLFFFNSTGVPDRAAANPLPG